MLLGNTTEFAHMTLSIHQCNLNPSHITGSLSETLNPVDMSMDVREQFRMVYPIVFEGANIQCIIPLPTVCIGDAVGRYCAFNEGYQGAAISVWGHSCVNLPSLLKQVKYRGFSCGLRPILALAATVEVACINFGFTPDIALFLASNPLARI